MKRVGVSDKRSGVSIWKSKYCIIITLIGNIIEIVSKSLYDLYDDLYISIMNYILVVKWYSNILYKRYKCFLILAISWV